MTTDGTGKHALFSAAHPAEAAPATDPLIGGDEPGGTEALYSVGAHRPGSVVFECSSCELRTRMSTVEAGLRIAMLSLWIPGRHFSRWMLCPSCRTRRWSRIEWLN